MSTFEQISSWMESVLSSLCASRRGPQKLENIIHAKVLRSAGFIPRDQLDNIISKDAVAAELLRPNNRRKRELSQERIQELAEKVCGSGTGGKEYLEVFAILSLIRRTDQIEWFLDHGISDAKLPLREDSERLRHPDRHLEHQFKLHQWEIHVPSFCVDASSTRYDEFPPEAKLPFSHEKKNGFSGASAEVFKVGIHLAHCRRESKPSAAKSGQKMANTRCAWVAVKRLNSGISHDDFLQEFRILKRLSSTAPHNHLISLLASYRLNDQYNLMFPWADANLNEYWRFWRLPRTPPCKPFMRMAKTEARKKEERWMVQQCLGLLEGLEAIHRHPTTTGSSLLPTQNRRSPRSPRPHCKTILNGRHGDIKPENILWFPEQQGLGILKIADFGLAEFTGQAVDSRPRRNWKDGVPNSPTYQPPEQDKQASDDSLIGPHCDVWSLGCVYLEFVAWHLGGWRMVKKFAQRRVKEEPGKYGRDTFFEMRTLGDGNRQFVVKPVVGKLIEQLKQCVDPTEPISDFLDLIGGSMIVVGKHCKINQNAPSTHSREASTEGPHNSNAAAITAEPEDSSNEEANRKCCRNIREPLEKISSRYHTRGTQGTET